MRTLFTLALLGCIFFAIYWFLAFQKDPYTNCKDHPNKKLRDEYYLCQPGDFDFPKGIFEKTVPTPWMKTKSAAEKKSQSRDYDEVDNEE